MSTAPRAPLTQVYNEMHGLFVQVGKHYCHKQRAQVRGVSFGHDASAASAISSATQSAEITIRSLGDQRKKSSEIAGIMKPGATAADPLVAMRLGASLNRRKPGV